MNFWLLTLLLIANGSEKPKNHEEGKEWTRKPRISTVEDLIANQMWKWGEAGQSCDTKATYINGYCGEFCQAGETEWRVSCGIHTLPLQCIACDKDTYTLIFPWTGGWPTCAMITSDAAEVECEANTKSKDCWDCNGYELGKHCEGKGEDKKCRAVCYCTETSWIGYLPKSFIDYLPGNLDLHAKWCQEEEAFWITDPRKEFKEYQEDVPKNLCCPEEFPLIGANNFGSESGPYLCYDESKTGDCSKSCNYTFYNPHQCGTPGKLEVLYQ